jgi:hypothetical protein
MTVEKRNLYGEIVDGPDSSSQSYWLVTKADADLPRGICRGLLVGTAGTANLMDAAGNIQANVPLQVGYNPLQARQVRTSGTADNIWALY